MPCVGTQPTGSSIRSRSRKAHPGHASRAPMAPMRSPSHGRATVQIAAKRGFSYSIMMGTKGMTLGEMGENRK